MAHVFIVDENTFPIHLKYKFAGTGAKNYKCSYLTDNSIDIKWYEEKKLTGMIADISRVKKGDNVIFYLQHKGLFFGSFKVVDKPFLCNDNYLEDELGKNLTFRVNIMPDNVFSMGITERECLDSLEGIEHPSQMCWSLIYRKLKGKRGCTMITNYEYKSIMRKIKAKNNGIYLKSKNFNYCDDSIVPINDNYEYTGKKESLSIKNRLIDKMKRKNACEVHLQAYILQNILDIKCLDIKKENLIWLGNEVSCGVGMQSMDICFIQEFENEIKISICELKYIQPAKDIIYQLKKYVDWITDYIIPTYNKKVIIEPIIIASKPNNQTLRTYNEIKKMLDCNNKKNIVKDIKYISFSEKNNEIYFEEVLNE